MAYEPTTEEPSGHDEPHPSTIDPDPGEGWGKEE